MTSVRTHGWKILVALGIALLAGAALAAVYRYEPPPPRTSRARPRLPRRPLAAVGCALALAGVLLGAAYAYDASRRQVIAPGISVGEVSVGGLTAAAARRKVAHAYERLQRPVVVRFGVRRFLLGAFRAGVAVHVDEAVARALDRSRDGWFLSRTVRDLTGPEADAELVPRITFSPVAVHRFVDRVEAALERLPRAARVVPRADGLVLHPARDGVEVDGGRLRRLVARALRDPDVSRLIPAPMRRVRPRVGVAELARRYPAFITVDRANFRLRVYERLRLTRTYPIAVGQIGFDTPAGLYHIQNKAVDPSWSVPTSSWTGSLAGAVIPPGPANPLKARWMGIYSGAGIHGTDQTWSLGTAASHGCIRMSIPDVIDLYDRVSVGTPIYIG